MRLLVTRPKPESERTAVELRSLGHDVMLAPMLRIESMPDSELGEGPFAAVLLTSVNGARAIAVHPRRAELIALPALAVGQSSAEAARSAGFTDVMSADGDGSDLTRLVASRFSGLRGRLLYAAGEDRARDIGDDLAAHGIRVVTAVVYRTVKATKFEPPIARALEQGRIDGVLHFSRRSVEGYLDCARDILALALGPVHYCLSERAAGPLRYVDAADVRVAVRPDEASLLALLR